MKVLLIVLLGFSALFSAIDINTAGAKELTKLKGVGVKKAQLILDYREVECFKNVSEFVNVKGIGKKTLEKNKENLTVSTCKKK